jgi:hypothetical protein
MAFPREGKVYVDENGIDPEADYDFGIISSLIWMNASLRSEST